MSSINTDLAEIFNEHKGKLSDKWASYIKAYSLEFEKYRNNSINVLEIGSQNCGTLEIWAKYFSKSKLILGTDIESIESLSFSDPRIKTIICDSTKLKDNNYLKKFKFDIMIDDASHISKHVIINFLSLYPLLNDNGVYVVEDLSCSYWKKFNENNIQRSMYFFSNLVNFINLEHWTEEYETEIKKLFFHNFPVEIDLDNLKKLFDTIHTIKFYNSMCFIFKGKSKNHIGERVVRGKDFPIIKNEVENFNYLKKKSNPTIESYQELESAYKNLEYHYLLLKDEHEKVLNKDKGVLSKILSFFKKQNK